MEVLNFTKALTTGLIAGIIVIMVKFLAGYLPMFMNLFLHHTILDGFKNLHLLVPIVLCMLMGLGLALLAKAGNRIEQFIAPRIYLLITAVYLSINLAVFALLVIGLTRI
ncbi:MAG: hypothetical protein WC980_09385 [Candidatus Brocadiia bacterium]